MSGSDQAVSGQIFMCYRRAEADYPAGWLYERLVTRFGREMIFKDVDSIDLGDDFVEAISEAVGNCDALIAFIGDRWLTMTDEHGNRRIDDPHDFVRLEIEAALRRDVRVIPILIGNAKMPGTEELPASLAALSRRQALELNPNRFMSATGHLLRVLDKTIADASARRSAEATANRVAAVGVTSAPEGDDGPAQDALTSNDEGTEETPAAKHPAPASPGVASLQSGSRRPGTFIAAAVALAMVLAIVGAAVRWGASPDDHSAAERPSSTTVRQTPSSSTVARRSPQTTLAPLDAAGVPTNWKRYVDRRHRFAFSYPQDWKVRNQLYVNATGPNGLSIDVIVYDNSRVRDPLQVLKDYAPMVDNVHRSVRLEGGTFAGRRAGFWEFFLDSESDHRLLVNFFRGSDRFSLHFIASQGHGWSELMQIRKYFERSFEISN